MRRIFICFCTLGLALLPFISNANPEEVNRAITLSERLNEDGMIDYSYRLLKREIAKNPPEVGLLKIQLAATYMVDNKKDQALSIIKSFPQSSKYYPQAQFKLGYALLQRRENKDGVAALMRYINFYKAKYKANPPAKGTHAYEEFGRAVGYANYAYKQLGDVQSATAVLDLLKLLNPEQRDSSGGVQGNPQMMYLKMVTMIDAAEKMKAEGGSSKWMTQITSALKTVDKLAWFSGNPAIAFAVVQKVRGLYLLGRYEDALRADRDYKDFIKAMDKAYKKQGKGGSAPGAGLRYWQGCAYLALAKKATTEKKQVEYYKKAFKRFYAVLLLFEGYSKAPAAYSKFLACKDYLEKQLGKVIRYKKFNPPKKLAEKIIPAKADSYFKDGKYDKAFPILLQVTQEKRTNPAVGEAIYKLTMCYLHKKEPLAAAASAIYLADVYPNSPFTVATLLKTATSLWGDKPKKYRKGAPPIFKDTKLYSISVYESYLKHCKSDKYGGDIATRLASYYYNLAGELAKKANSLPAGVKRSQLTKRAMAMYLMTSDKFKFIVDNYGNRKKYSNNALYMMAVCHNSAKEYHKAIALYEKYEQREQDNKKQIANAKLSIADCYFRLARKLEKKIKVLKAEAYKIAPSQDKDAAKNPNTREGKLLVVAQETEKVKAYYNKIVDHLNELIYKWMVPGGRIGKVNGNTRKAHESAMQLLAWGYDGAERFKEAALAFKRFIAAYPKNKTVPTCMMRLGVIYTNLGDNKAATDVLASLARKFPNSPEGKSAPFFLGKSLYKIEKYDRALSEFKAIFDKKLELSVPNLRWIALNLSKAPEKYSQAAGKVALQAVEVLLKRLKTPVLEDWVGRKQAVLYKKGSKKYKKLLAVLKGQLLYIAAQSALKAKMYAKTVQYVDTVLKADDNSPYFFELKFARAEALMNMTPPKYADAKNDLGDIAQRALGLKPRRNDINYKCQVKLGLIFEKEGNYKRALAAVDMVTTELRDTGLGEDVIKQNKPKKPRTPEEEKQYKEQRFWLEEGVFLALKYSAKLKDSDEVFKLQQIYRKNFPNGRYTNQVNKFK